MVINQKIYWGLLILLGLILIGSAYITYWWSTGGCQWLQMNIFKEANKDLIGWRCLK